MGELGPQARAFGGFLADAGQSIWQILPIGPVGYGYSPYSSLSAFAGNYLMISFDELLEEGLLTERQLESFPVFDPHRIDFPVVIAAREKVLFEVADRFPQSREFTAFCKQESGWLADYALFMALREEMNFRCWTEWPAELRDRNFQTLEKMRRKLAPRVRRHEVLQYLFSRHWKKTADFFRQKNISIAGDIPIFVAEDSVDVWANRELFFLKPDGTPSLVAGVPPDYFSETGQRWGNPLYDWAAHRASGYRWWTLRMQRSLAMTDIVRIDHFRGFEAYWEIPASEPTAIKGHWRKGPGVELFQVMERQLREMDGFPGGGRAFRLADHVIAENLGIITDEVEALRESCGFPGMWVLQFRFGEEPLRLPGYRPEGTEKNWAVYTGTHDNDTAQGWFSQLSRADAERVKNYLKTDGTAIHRDLAELAMQAPAKWAILPLQDVLGLGHESRMNTPATTAGNWNWRFSSDMIGNETVVWLKAATIRAGRA